MTPRPLLAARAKARGYTAVEVMLSVVVLAVGASGVMAMQRASIQGNADAHQLDMANSLAREWVERVERDSFTWTQPDDSTGSSETSGTANWSTNTYILSQIAASANVGTWQYVTPPSGSFDGFSPAADLLGRDLPLVGSTFLHDGYAPVFCTQLKADWMVQDQLLRLTVRTFWLRQLYTAGPGSNFCVTDDSTTGPSSTNANQIYHFVYAVTSIRRNPGQ